MTRETDPVIVEMIKKLGLTDVQTEYVNFASGPAHDISGFFGPTPVEIRVKIS